LRNHNASDATILSQLPAFLAFLLSLAYCSAALLGSAEAVLAAAAAAAAASTVHHTTPQAGSMCKKYFLMQEAPAAKTCLLYLHSTL